MKWENPPADQHNEPTLLEDWLVKKYADFLQLTDDRYLYWDELKHRNNLPYDDPFKAWQLTRLHRKSQYKSITFANSAFNYYLTEHIQQDLHEFDLKLIGGLYKDPITPQQSVDYLRHSLFDEAIASSQIEGAATTTKVAKDMLKSGRNPRSESEQMIVNNLRGIQLIGEKLDTSLDKSLILEIHRTMTANTRAEYCAGNYRSTPTYVQDHVDGEIAHTPPEPELLRHYMDDLIHFVNSDTPFLHPIVKASIVHFMIGYIHPFSDGNGRTARALFYWYLMKKGYALMKNISISRVILQSRIQYDKAFLKTESDHNDLTYFIHYSIKSLRVAFGTLIKYRDKKKAEKDQVKLIAYQLLDKGLNKRQADFIGYLSVKKDAQTNITTYAQKHRISRQTARKDLKELVTLGLIKEKKEGRDVVFNLGDQQRIEQFLSA